MARLLWWSAFNLYGRIVPWRTIPLLAALLALLLRPFGIRRSVALRNLHAAELGSDMSPGTVERRSFRNLVRVYLEIPRLAHADRRQIEELLVISGAELLRSAAIRETGGLLLSGHTGNWELLAMSAALQSGRPFTIPVRRQRDYGYLGRLRSRFGNRPVVIEEDRGGRSIRTLADGGIVAMLADQSPGPDDPVIPFLGLPTRFHAGPARLALRFRPIVILGFARRAEGGGYRVALQELRYGDLQDDPAGRREFTRRYAALLEQEIRADPPAWIWHHRRWKQTDGVRYDR